MSKVVFEIHESLKVKNSPFSVEGSTARFEFTNEFQLPAETVAFIDKKPTRIRFLMDCDTIILEEQIKRGIPADRQPTDEERKMLTFIGARLIADDEEWENLVLYIRSAPWFDEYKGTRPAGSRIIYTEYKQALVEETALDFERLVHKAKGWILDAKRTACIDILRLYAAGGTVSVQLDLKTIKLRLMELATSNPSFILDGVKSGRDKLVVLVSKAVDYGFLNLDVAGFLALVTTPGGEPQPFQKVGETGGRKGKLEKAVVFFESEDGKAYKEQLQGLVREFEASNPSDEGSEEAVANTADKEKGGDATSDKK